MNNETHFSLTTVPSFYQNAILDLFKIESRSRKDESSYMGSLLRSKVTENRTGCTVIVVLITSPKVM